LVKPVSAVVVSAFFVVSIPESVVYVDPVEVTCDSAFPLAVVINAWYYEATFTGPVAVSTLLLAVDHTSNESVMVVCEATDVVARAVFVTISLARAEKFLERHFSPTSLPPPDVGTSS
jgi:hypothetical protein